MAKPNGNIRFRVEYDPRLVEAAVLLRIAGDREERRFYRARDLIYELEDAEGREARFREFHQEWFFAFRLGQPVQGALLEQPAILRQVRRCCVVQAVGAREEGADLHELRDARPETAAAGRAILIRLRTDRLLDASALQAWLRHELMHIADMLDPGFGYERIVPSGEAGPAYANLLRDRYRVLWDTCIDGRLARRGWLAEGARQRRWEEFRTTFPALGERAEAQFEQFFNSTAPTHQTLMDFALRPGIAAGVAPGKIPGPQLCPLCRFPVYRLLSGREELSEEICGQVRADFSNWLPEHGLCVQCADLYRMREMSRAAEASLPRI